MEQISLQVLKHVSEEYLDDAQAWFDYSTLDLGDLPFVHIDHGPNMAAFVGVLGAGATGREGGYTG